MSQSSKFFLFALVSFLAVMTAIALYKQHHDKNMMHVCVGSAPPMSADTLCAEVSIPSGHVLRLNAGVSGSASYYAPAWDAANPRLGVTINGKYVKTEVDGRDLVVTVP